jgi:hypothetical protein
MVAGMVQNFAIVSDKTYLNDVSKLLGRQALGIDLPKFSGDVKEWPTFNSKMLLRCLKRIMVGSARSSNS